MERGIPSAHTTPPFSSILNTGTHSCIWGGGSNSLAPALFECTGRRHRAEKKSPSNCPAKLTT